MRGKADIQDKIQKITDYLHSDAGSKDAARLFAARDALEWAIGERETFWEDL